MQPTVYQKPEIRDANDNIIQQGAFGKNTALANSTNDGWIDYVANDLEFLYDLAKDEVVPVPSLPASGQTNKTYLLTTTGVSYRWSGTEWVAVSSSEAVGRAETAANLAEQWATKTSGTVDGTEYSAKYYAQQAEASADDAQDVADDMADHLVQIDKNTGGVAKNSKRISNIEKLLQGNLYDYDTDDDTAYTKTVPAGALPYAGIEKLGGKTLVWNQLFKRDTDNTRTVYGIDVTFTASTQTVTIANTATQDGAFRLTFVNTPLPVGHKILAITNTALLLRFQGASNTFTGNGITEATSSTVTDLVVLVTNGTTYNETFKINMFDLTLMFGAGNEPSTVQEFQQMFPADYYPYNAGTLLSAGVTEVKSVGKNLLDVMNPWRYGNNFYNLEIGAQPVGNSPTYKPTDNGDGTFTFTPESNWYGFIFLAEVDMSKTHKFYAQAQATSNRTTLYLLDSDHKILWKSNPNTAATQNLSVTFGGAEAAYPQAKYFAFVIGTGTAGTTVTITNPQLEVGSTATAYVPYMEATMPIPAEVQALTGYGWSAGTAYNYVDFERKVFVKCVDRVVFDGTQGLSNVNWRPQTNTVGWGYSLTLTPNIKRPSSNTALANVVANSVETKTYYDLYNTDVIGIGVIQQSNTSGLFVRGNSTLTTTTTINAYLSANPITVYYELDTPIETDISQYLTDNLIEVESGGTLTFPNSNGNDYHIPIPSTETYMIDLQEAISNG